MQKVILVVEQNVNVRDTITHMLRRDGYLVLAAADAATALDIAKLNPISLMIVDPESLQPGWSDLFQQLHTYDETTHAEREILVADTLRIDLGRRRVTREDQQIRLGSSLLFDLLVYLVRHRGDVLTRDQLLKHVWCREGAQDTRTVDVHMHWLRRKLHDNPDDPQLIQTVPGMGYRFLG